LSKLKTISVFKEYVSLSEHRLKYRTTDPATCSVSLFLLSLKRRCGRILGEAASMEDWFLLEHEMPWGGAHRSHWRLVLPLIHVVPGSLTYSVPLFLRRQCNRTLGVQLDVPARTAQAAAAVAVAAVAVAAGGGSR
jgi:hypothetical protein